MFAESFFRPTNVTKMTGTPASDERDEDDGNFGNAQALSVIFRLCFGRFYLNIQFLSRIVCSR